MSASLVNVVLRNVPLNGPNRFEATPQLFKLITDQLVRTTAWCNLRRLLVMAGLTLCSDILNIKLSASILDSNEGPEI